MLLKRSLKEFKELTGREYKRVESYLMDDAEVAIVALGTTVETSMLQLRSLEKRELKQEL